MFTHLRSARRRRGVHMNAISHPSVRQSWKRSRTRPGRRVTRLAQLSWAALATSSLLAGDFWDAVCAARGREGFGALLARCGR